ncbi:MAG: M20 peptidase aminoacylase family protein [Alicyclobacillaceae bacterium]|nr:M20 peptidase aminoacylase family protein [Alicyclobacillaceae bacterium]
MSAVHWTERANAWKDEARILFDHLHSHPEVSWKEVETTNFLATQLQNLGLRVTTFPDIPGVLGEWGPTSGATVALRADIDALWQQVTGEWRANHSCGHDGHMTMVLLATRLLRERLPNPAVRIRVLFQPAEEKGEGAIRFTERGAVEDVVYLFGVHVRPLEELDVGRMSAAILNGAAIQLEGQVRGTAAHGARPHLGVNAIEVASAILQSVQGIHLAPMVPHTAKMTRLVAGGDSVNIIPDTASFAFDLRAQTNECMDALANAVESRIECIASMYGAEVEIWRGPRIMAAEVNPEARELMAASIQAVLGAEALAPDIVTPGAEDFHYYTSLRPGVKATMLGLGCGVAPGLHHPQMTFQRELLLDGAKILAEVVSRAVDEVGGISADV